MSYFLKILFFCTGIVTFFGLEGTALTHADVFNPYPKDKNGNQIANAHTKTMLPQACRQGTYSSLMSFIKTATPEVNHPDAGQLFPDDAALSGLLNTFLTNLSKDEVSKNFTLYFTKIHLLILHELYIYLTKIYAVFNMTHIDSLLPGKDATGAHIQGYLQEGMQQAWNQKTLIINHLVNIVEAQSNGAIRARFPTLPPMVATYAGNILMKHDYGVDLNIMMDQYELFLVTDTGVKAMLDPKIDEMRNNYLGLFGDYLNFFTRYTAGLNEDSATQGYISGNTFATHAKRISQIMDGILPNVPSSIATVSAGGKSSVTVSPDKIAWLRSLKKLNPPLFFYDEQTMRGLKVIPSLARSFPNNVQSVPWPAKVVSDANNKVYYKPIYGSESTTLIAFYSPDKSQLFVNIPTMDYKYIQELLPQPDWLNSFDGIMKMLQACLGNFAALLDPVFHKEDILDPCIQCMIYNAATKAGIKVAKDDVSCAATTAFINALKKKIQAEQQQSGSKQQPPSLPDGDNP